MSVDDLNDAYRKWVGKIKAEGMTKSALASWMGMSPFRVGRWLKGEKSREITSNEMARIERHAARLIALLEDSPARKRWGDSSAEPLPAEATRARQR